MKDVICEYKELLASKLEIEQKLILLSKEYISKNTIDDKQYLYLQICNEDSAMFKNIEFDEVKEMINRASLRKEYEAKLSEIISKLNNIENTVALDKVLNRKLNLLRLISGMDSLSADEKEKRILFSDAMTSIEGTPVSDRVKKDLEDWKNGKVTFLSIFEQTLKRYGFIMWIPRKK